ncbi:hypothetical protein FEK30_10365 [Picosynechococcus sp. PCC 11901]|uniref:ATP-binding domain-containing protein n=1 Tax=Picosynechococcus sp. PCC 11901 TaxID=2579791 RepID=UPI0010FBE999|nr:ATP-binding domain-containing protein [Picosynechococcus sp. PCC 11901]QCS49809.1 hypothetical protein FEK30_10365 [Picosynechococcus sp. PCC 11901]
MKPIKSKLSSFHWTEGQKQVLAGTDKWLEDDSTALVITGMVNTGKKAVLAEVIRQVEQHGLTPILLMPNERIAQRYRLQGFEKCHSVYAYLYSSQPDRLEKIGSGADVSVHEVKLTPQDVDGKCLIFVEAHLLANGLFATETTRFGTGYLVDDLLEAVGDTPPKMVLVGDPYQFSRDKLELSFIHSHLFEEKKLKSVQVVVDEQLCPDPEQQGLLNFQFDLANHLKRKHYNRLPNPDGKQVREIDKEIDILNKLSTGCPHSVYLCALNKDAHSINLAVKKELRPHGVPGLEVGDWVDFHNRTPVVMDSYDSFGLNGQEVSYVNAGEIGVVEWVDDQEEVHPVQLKGRDKPTDLRFNLMRCKVPGLGSVKVRYLPDYLIAEEPKLSPDQLIAMSIIARQQAERELGDLKDELAQLKESENEADKSTYKAKKKLFDQSVDHHMMSSGYFNAARIRFAYAMTVHKAQGRKWSHVILNAERSPSSDSKSHDNDGYFRYLYTAVACSSTKLSLEKYPDLNPLTKCSFKANPKCKIGPFDFDKPLRYNRDRQPNDREAKLQLVRELTEAKEKPELIALFLTINDRLEGSGWEIKPPPVHHQYQECYTFVNAQDQTVEAKIYYTKDFTVSKAINWDAKDIDQAELRKLEDYIYGDDTFCFDNWSVKEAVQELDSLLMSAGFSRVSVKEKSAYLAQVDFSHSHGMIKLEINLKKTGLASSISPLQASDEKLIDAVRELIDSL